MMCVLVFLAMALVKVPSFKKAQEFLQDLESKFVMVANRYTNVVSFFQINIFTPSEVQLCHVTHNYHLPVLTGLHQNIPSSHNDLGICVHWNQKHLPSD